MTKIINFSEPAFDSKVEALLNLATDLFPDLNVKKSRGGNVIVGEHFITIFPLANRVNVYNKDYLEKGKELAEVCEKKYSEREWEVKVGYEE